MEDMENSEYIPFFDKKGYVIKTGWARFPYWDYNSKKRKILGEIAWDEYVIFDEKEQVIIPLLFATIGKRGFYRIGYVSYKDAKSVSLSQSEAHHLHPWRLYPNTIDDIGISFANEQMTVAAVKKGGKRQLLFSAPHLILPASRYGLKVFLSAKMPGTMESLTTSRADGYEYALHQQIIGMQSDASIRIDHKATTIKALTNLDWVRMKRKGTHEFMYLKGCESLDGTPFGFSIRFASLHGDANTDDSFISCGEKITHIPEGKAKLNEKENGKLSVSTLDGLFSCDFMPNMNTEDKIKCGTFKANREIWYGYAAGYYTSNEGVKRAFGPCMAFFCKGFFSSSR